MKGSVHDFGKVVKNDVANFDVHISYANGKRIS